MSISDVQDKYKTLATFVKNHLWCRTHRSLTRHTLCISICSSSHLLFLFFFYKQLDSHMRSDSTRGTSQAEPELHQPQGQLENSAVLAGETKGMRKRESNRFFQLTSTGTEQSCEPPRATRRSLSAELSGLDAGGLASSQSWTSVYSIIPIMLF